MACSSIGVYTRAPLVMDLVTLVLVMFGCCLFDGPYEYFNIGIIILYGYICIITHIPTGKLSEQSIL